ncbi:hypothetical protein ADIMK_3028 [Marinobacterium lacunae]|uniref:DUF1611 domain-containing protein n=1 Tax=Marinobacterium lacunae TaxID=1232683 RepID=A0A081FWC4_9GAMM|nr:hypothetical protein ADIMK_3028 [Marinobacterium lacunae]
MSEGSALLVDNLAGAKRAFTTRNVDLTQASRIGEASLAPGDVVVARVERVRQHTRLEDQYGRRVWLYPGDRLILVAAPRYSTAQYHADMPSDTGECHLVASGGIAAWVRDRSLQVKPATELTLEGVLLDKDGVALNLKRFQTLPAYEGVSNGRLSTVLVLGSDMDSGKTTTACATIKGLTNAGFRVQGAKLTGTGAGPDYWRMLDAGATHVSDFVDAGFASTSGATTDQILEVLARIHRQALERGNDLLVVEVADGVLQPETSALLASPVFTSFFDGVLVAGDNASAAAFVSERVAMAGMPILAISGALTRSPLAGREVTAATGLPVFTPDQLQSADVVQSVLAPLLRGGDVALGAVE